VVERILDPLFSGITLSCIYAIIGYGMMVFFSVTKILQFSAGEFAMLGGMISAILYAIGLPLTVSITLGIITSCLISIIMWLVFLQRPVARHYTTDILIFLTVGIHLLIVSVAFLVWQTEFRELPYFIDVAPFKLGGTTISPQAPWIWGIVLLILVGLSMLFDRTLWGKGLSACAIQPVAARLMGINPLTMAFISFVLVALLASVGGVMLTPLVMTQYSVGMGFTVKGFLAGAAGGLNKPQGPVIGGLILGLVESFSGAFVSSRYMVPISLGVLLIILLIRPQGIVGVKEEV
jgi:branched-chain amino acid transport system permease protein